MICDCVSCRKLDTKKRQLARAEEQLQKLEVQATDKVRVITVMHLLNLFWGVVW